MPLTPGTRLGVYEITAQIGEGGMGAVYRATDTSLSRQVAVKVLPEAFAADPDRLARFDAEPARTYDIDVFVVLAGTTPASLVSLERFYQWARLRGVPADVEPILVHLN